LLLVAWLMGAFILLVVAVGLALFGQDARGRRPGVLGGRVLFALVWPLAIHLEDGRRALLSMFAKTPRNSAD
jgi:hypothetical protein